MGIISILFLIFGWIFSVKGLVIASLVLSTIFCLLLFAGMAAKVDNKGSKADLIVQAIVLALAIIRLAM